MPLRNVHNHLQHHTVLQFRTPWTPTAVKTSNLIIVSYSCTWGCGGMTHLILTVGTWWRWMFTPRPLCPRGKEPQVPAGWEAEWVSDLMLIKNAISGTLAFRRITDIHSLTLRRQLAFHFAPSFDSSGSHQSPALLVLGCAKTLGKSLTSIYTLQTDSANTSEQSLV
jgi:hypothetical protein